ncbi:glutathione S-transferase N-terminal domain-containing protein [Bradyrhizobium sp. AZCC 2289]|uniref:glutathione S-transferase N-terminal domain-containing protein n=1 Tax=Bradyrhizobium sp. AZCC 2289 TaxID=3117026 RepID=UPI003FA5FC96
MAQRGFWKSKGLARGSEAAPIDHLHEIKDVFKVEHDATVATRLEAGGSPRLILSSTAPLTTLRYKILWTLVLFASTARAGAILDLARGDTHRPDFRKISRFSRIPALMIDDGRTTVESGAILTYLAEGTEARPLAALRPPEETANELPEVRGPLDAQDGGAGRAQLAPPSRRRRDTHQACCLAILMILG